MNISLGPSQGAEPTVRPGVIVHFESFEQFQEVHKTATEFENNVENGEIDAFNKQNNTYKAWPLIALPSGNEEEIWVILVESRPSVEERIPRIGETCQLYMVDPVTGKDFSAWWTVRRISNRFKKSWSNLIVFSTTLAQSTDAANSVMQALVPIDDKQDQHLASLELNDGNAVCVGLFFSKSEATFDAEMKSLHKLGRAMQIPFTAIAANNETTDKADNAKPKSLWPSKKPRLPDRPRDDVANPNAVHPKQVAAAKYLLDFRDPAFSLNMFEKYPHMTSPKAGEGLPPHILRKYRRMNVHQKEAYHGLLADMPCGLAFLPGGPGGGKTEWAMTVIGLLQCKSNAKVLYLLDINDPLDDATAKYVKMVRAARLAKRPIRMRNFGTEFNKSVRVGAVHGRAKGGSIRVEKSNEPEVDFSKDFLRIYASHTEETATRHHNVIPTLDEAAWNRYEADKTKFPELTDLLENCNDSALQNRALRCEIFSLYQVVLCEADFIATTPCVAATAFYRMFSPDLVVFDEAAHARELSTLIAVANFCPTAGWIFIGDHRQTQPTVKSHRTNPQAQQLATSAMERAHLAGALKHQLLINHRAYGRLERLASKLIYDAKMVSGIPHAEKFPSYALFVKEYLEDLASGQVCSVPRLIVHLSPIGRPVQVGTSWYHPQHMTWTMERVADLVKDCRFRSAENPNNGGTILLLAPYKAAVTKYQQAIEVLAETHPGYRILERVEARTWDSSQGHEADIVAIDYVRDHVTDFMDGMYRFNVGLTRARQGEWHLMHPEMPTRVSFAYTKYLRRLYDACKVGLDGLHEGRVVTLNLSVTEAREAVPAPYTTRGATFASTPPTLPLDMESSSSSAFSGRSASPVELETDAILTPVSTRSHSLCESAKNAETDNQEADAGFGK